MTSGIGLPLLAAVALTGLAMTGPAQAQQAGMTFFVASAGKGNGADLGGLAGADAHCQALASAAGSTNTNWRAYLSTTEPGGAAGVNARDRIGKGPWQNAKGVVVAKSVEDLHSDSNNITKQTALTEKGETVNGRGDAVNTHDVLTGSDPQGLFSTAGGDTTCGNWTKSGEGSAIVGHHDRAGLQNTRHMNSWNSSHGSRGCSQDNLKATGGAGLIYGFPLRGNERTREFLYAALSKYLRRFARTRSSGATERSGSANSRPVTFSKTSIYVAAACKMTSCGMSGMGSL